MVETKFFLSSVQVLKRWMIQERNWDDKPFLVITNINSNASLRTIWRLLSGFLSLDDSWQTNGHGSTQDSSYRWGEKRYETDQLEFSAALCWLIVCSNMCLKSSIYKWRCYLTFSNWGSVGITERVGAIESHAFVFNHQCIFYSFFSLNSIIFLVWNFWLR